MGGPAPALAWEDDIVPMGEGATASRDRQHRRVVARVRDAHLRDVLRHHEEKDLSLQRLLAAIRFELGPPLGSLPPTSYKDDGLVAPMALDSGPAEVTQPLRLTAPAGHGNGGSLGAGAVADTSAPADLQ